MRGEIRISSLPKAVLNNKVLVGVVDTFETFITKGGINLVNLTMEDSWGDSNEYNISEFVMRHGQVILVPEVITKGSFNYKTEVELIPGDKVFWNLISFQNHIPLVHNKQLFLLVDYHEILARQRDGVVTPINGYGLFTSVEKTKNFLSYKVIDNCSDEWILKTLPEKNVKYDKGSRTVADCWEIGDKVHLLVHTSPFKLEGSINRSLDEELYACPMNYIICTV